MKGANRQILSAIRSALVLLVRDNFCVLVREAFKRGPGVLVHAGEELRGARPTAPFSEYIDGRCIRHKQRVRPDESTAVSDSSVKTTHPRIY